MRLIQGQFRSMVLLVGTWAYLLTDLAFIGQLKQLRKHKGAYLTYYAPCQPSQFPDETALLGRERAFMRAQK